jgi:hypothetical protein
MNLVGRSCGKLRCRRDEDWEEIVWVCGEARADADDFLFNGSQLEVSTDENVR